MHALIYAQKYLFMVIFFTASSVGRWYFDFHIRLVYYVKGYIIIIEECRHPFPRKFFSSLSYADKSNALNVMSHELLRHCRRKYNTTICWWASLWPYNIHNPREFPMLSIIWCSCVVCWNFSACLTSLCSINFDVLMFAQVYFLLTRSPRLCTKCLDVRY